MNSSYRKKIAKLIKKIPFDIDTNFQVNNRRQPTMANSMFLTNREQGDWAEEIVFNAINEYSHEYCAVRYGHGSSLSAGDPGFADFYNSYIDELNSIGKKPDILVYKRGDVPEKITAVPRKSCLSIITH